MNKLPRACWTCQRTWNFSFYGLFLLLRWSVFLVRADSFPENAIMNLIWIIFYPVKDLFCAIDIPRRFKLLGLGWKGYRKKWSGWLKAEEYTKNISFDFPSIFSSVFTLSWPHTLSTLEMLLHLFLSLYFTQYPWFSLSFTPLYFSDLEILPIST